MPRKCGTCSACCRWPSVPEINKPARVPCQHLEKKGYGCTIYADRPKMCAAYRCSWLRGIGATSDQPDKCHVLIDRKMTKWGFVLVAKSLKPGAVTRTQGRDAISRAAQQENMLCLIVSDDNSDSVIDAAGPRVLIEQFKSEIGQLPVDLGGTKAFVQHLTNRICEGQWPAM